MPELPERVKDAVAPHICDGESVRAARSVQKQTDHTKYSTVVTDCRVLDVKAHRRDAEVDIDVSSYSLADDRIFGVEYDENASTNVGLLKVVAVIAGLLGALLLLVGLSNDGGGEALVVALMLFGGAALAWYLSSDSVSGDVTVRVESTATPKQWEFPRGANEVPQAISRVAMEHQS